MSYHHLRIACPIFFVCTELHVLLRWVPVCVVIQSVLTLVIPIHRVTDTVQCVCRGFETRPYHLPPSASWSECVLLGYVAE